MHHTFTSILVAWGLFTLVGLSFLGVLALASHRINKENKS